MSLAILSRVNAGAPWGEGLGGLLEIPTSQIASALAGRGPSGRMLDERAVWVAQVFYGLNPRATRYLIEAVAEEFRNRCDAEKWRRNGIGDSELEAFYQRVGCVICLQHFGGYHCPACGGTATDHQHKTCKACNGTGKGERRDEERAAELGLSHDAYRKTWKPRIQPLIGELESWESEAAAHVRYKCN